MLAKGGLILFLVITSQVGIAQNLAPTGIFFENGAEFCRNRGEGVWYPRCDNHPPIDPRTRIEIVLSEVDSKMNLCIRFLDNPDYTYMNSCHETGIRHKEWNFGDFGSKKVVYEGRLDWDSRSIKYQEVETSFSYDKQGELIRSRTSNHSIEVNFKPKTNSGVLTYLNRGEQGSEYKQSYSLIK